MADDAKSNKEGDGFVTEGWGRREFKDDEGWEVGGEERAAKGSDDSFDGCEGGCDCIEGAGVEFLEDG